MKIDEAAARLEALGNPTRLKIYRMLVRAGDPGLAVGKLQSRLSIPGFDALPPPEDADHRRARHPGARCDHPHLPRQLSDDARPGGVPGGGMLHGSRLRHDQAAGRHRRLDRFALNFDPARRMDTMSNPAKTVAIIGGGPVGLAAAAHALEPRPQAGRARGGRQGGTRRSPMVARAHVLALVLQRRQGAEALLREEGWNSPEPERYPTGGELVAQYLEPLATRTQLKAAHPDQRPRRLGGACRLRQGQDGGPGKRAF